MNIHTCSTVCSELFRLYPGNVLGLDAFHKLCLRSVRPPRSYITKGNKTKSDVNIYQQYEEFVCLLGYSAV
jgi:hypothetical protein